MHYKLKKIVNGNGHIIITCDDKLCDHNISRILTNTTGETEQGIFSAGEEKFIFGDFKVLSEDLSDYPNELNNTDDFEIYSTVLEKRINVIRSWVDRCKATAGTMDFKLLFKKE